MLGNLLPVFYAQGGNIPNRTNIDTGFPRKGWEARGTEWSKPSEPETEIIQLPANAWWDAKLFTHLSLGQLLLNWPIGALVNFCSKSLFWGSLLHSNYWLIYLDPKYLKQVVYFTEISSYSNSEFYIVFYWMTRKLNKWTLEPIKPETLLQEKMTELKLSHFRHIMRYQGSLEKTIMLRKKTGGNRKRGRPNLRWTP